MDSLPVNKGRRTTGYLPARVPAQRYLKFTLTRTHKKSEIALVYQRFSIFNFDLAKKDFTQATLDSSMFYI